MKQKRIPDSFFKKEIPLGKKAQIFKCSLEGKVARAFSRFLGIPVEVPKNK